MEQACFAEAAGFDGIWLTEHNFTGESVYCDPIPFASVVAARTSRIRIGFAVIQLALRHPIRLATELALLDNLSGGRLDVGVGHGTNFNEYEFVGFGLRSDDSRERMAETLDVMVRAWTEAPLVHQGKFYQLSLPELRPRPRQRPLPAHLARGLVGGLGPRVRPARRADHDRAHPDLARAGAPRPVRRRGLAESGLDGARQQRLREQVALWRFVHVAESQAQAEDELRTRSWRRAGTWCTPARPTTPPTYSVDDAREPVE